MKSVHCTILLLFCALGIWAQGITYPCSKQIEKGQFDKALPKLQKMHSKNPGDCATNYALFQYYFAKTNPDFDTRKAYIYLSLSDSCFNAADEKQHVKLMKQGFMPGVFNSHYEAVAEQALNEAIAANTIEAYNDFLNYYQKAGTQQKRKAKANRSALAFGMAKKVHSIEAYRRFIDDYPDAAELQQAWFNIYELAYAEASAANTISAYQAFIDTYPTANQVKQAQTRIYTIAFEDAVKANTESALNEYVKQFPQSPLKEVAIQKVNEMHNRSLLSTLPPHPDIPTLEKAIEYWREGSARDSCLKMLHGLYAKTYDLIALRQFHNKYDEPCLKQLKAHDEKLIDMFYNTDMYSFIRAAAPYPIALMALREEIQSYMQHGQWNAAKQVVDTFADAFGYDHDYRDLLRVVSEPIDNSIKITSIGSNINTPTGGEYAPTISADGKHLLFCGQGRQDNMGNEDIFISKLTNKGWGKAQLMPGVNSTYDNESPKSLSADGTYMTLFKSGTLCSAKKGKDGWNKPEPLPSNINVSGWQSDAMLTSDGKAMLFASKYQSKYELSPSVNIFVSLLDENGEWGEPIDLGPTINTSLQDRSPFLHPDMKTLYFSSEGHSAIGGMDVFMSTRLSEDSWTEWSEPVNLGKEINSISDDCWYKISTDGKTAYFSKGMSTKGDIYTLNLPERLRPAPVATIAGKLKDANGKPVVTTIKWEDLDTHEAVGQSHTDPEDGSYFIVLPTGKNYGYYIDDKTYFPVAENIDLRNTNEVVQLNDNIMVASFEQMIEQGIPMPLNNLFFNTAEYVILPASQTELQRVVEILKSRPLKVEISGHTDNVGSDAANQILSENRAEAVRQYLIENGIPNELLTTRGYGESKPVATNNTEAGRRKNRRVEIKFIK